jgi:hypothetical protein
MPSLRINGAIPLPPNPPRHFVFMECTGANLPHYLWLNVHDACVCSHCVMLYQLLSSHGTEWWADRTCLYTCGTVLGALAVECGQMQKTNQLLVWIRSGCLMTVGCIHYWSAVRAVPLLVFCINKLPLEIKNVADKQKKFKIALKKFLHTYSFYTIDEYLSQSWIKIYITKYLWW